MASDADKVATGQPWQPPTAKLHNSIVDAAIAHQRSGGIAGNIPKTVDSDPWIEVLVSSAADVAPFGVVGLGDPSLLAASADDGLAKIVLAKIDPVLGNFAIAHRGIPAGGAAQCVFRGISWAEVDIISGTHEFADIDDGTLSSVETGLAKIMWKPETTGLQWCLLNIGTAGGGGGGMLIKAVVGDADISPESEGEIQLDGSPPGDIGIWEHNTGGKILDAGGPIRVQGPREDGKYDIVAPDCRYLS